MLPPKTYFCVEYNKIEFIAKEFKGCWHNKQKKEAQLDALLVALGVKQITG